MTFLERQIFTAPPANVSAKLSKGYQSIKGFYAFLKEYPYAFFKLQFRGFAGLGFGLSELSKMSRSSAKRMMSAGATVLRGGVSSGIGLLQDWTGSAFRPPFCNRGPNHGVLECHLGDSDL